MKDPEVLEQEYRSAYLGEGGLYHPCDANTFYRLVDFFGKYRDGLPNGNIQFITRHMYINNLELICDPKYMEFDKTYIKNFCGIANLLIVYHEEIDKPSFMDYMTPCVSYYHGYEEYISESKEFKEFIEEAAMKYDLPKNRFIEKIHIIFCGLAAYLYYNGMDPKILNDVATSYFCYYHDMTEIFNMNNIYLYNHELNEEFYMNFLRVFDIYKDSKDPNQKVIR